MLTAQCQGTSRRKHLSDKWWRLTVKGVPQIRFEDKHDCLATALESGGLFPIRASPEDVSLGTDVPVREVWTDHLHRHQLCNQRMRPGLFMVPGSGGT